MKTFIFTLLFIPAILLAEDNWYTGAHWQDDIRNPDNEEYVYEVIFNIQSEIPHDDRTINDFSLDEIQIHFFLRYEELLHPQTVAYFKALVRAYRVIDTLY
jgi:hypothetical protein